MAKKKRKFTPIPVVKETEDLTVDQIIQEEEAQMAAAMARMREEDEDALPRIEYMHPITEEPVDSDPLIAFAQRTVQGIEFVTESKGERKATSEETALAAVVRAEQVFNRVRSDPEGLAIFIESRINSRYAESLRRPEVVLRGASVGGVHVTNLCLRGDTTEILLQSRDFNAMQRLFLQLNSL